MKMHTLLRTAAPVFLVLTLTAPPTPAQQLASGVHPDGAAQIARQAYIYGYPLVTTYVTRRVETNVAAPDENGRAPLNQFGSLFAYPTAKFKTVVAPNVNTLYTAGWFDVSKEPMIIHVPDTKDRYYVMEILDAWTNVIGSPGKRTTGTAAQDIAIVGPGWHGQLPRGIEHTFISPTSNVWVVNRIQANGPRDYPTVNALQRQTTATPLSSFGKPYTPPPGTVDPKIDTKTPPVKQVNAMSADEFFTALARQLMVNQPFAADSAVVRQMASIGIVPGQEFSMKTKDAATAKDIRSGARMGLEAIEKHIKTMGSMKNGWQTLNMCGKYGTDYLTRAGVALVGLGCNLPEDALYPTTMVDATGKPLMGSNRHVVHFDAGKIPPVNAFWSVTTYDSTFFLVNNSLNRYALSSYDNLKQNPDGSLDLYVQHESPGADNEANWLPAPAGKFVLMMRLYWPKPEAISGAWEPPSVRMTP